MFGHPKRDPVGPGQESVWDYPRPPIVDDSDELVRVIHRGVLLAESKRAMRVLETSHAPAYYIPASDVDWSHLQEVPHRTVCEYKGVASYADLLLPGEVPVRQVCWWYPRPSPGYEPLVNAVCFYPQRVDQCEVAGESVTPLASQFYGDWPTSRIAGPYKGAPGTEFW
ncbi:MAG: DUF427 domain-containing protein [Candidatus Nanopelagicales bacterium]|nr:DUF427 domain-containing protein [Candidatus Nanopelagicales bacterium]MCU0298260.1 DUF427 domain-containing protein [Candidatus Nanopelagicales bacterium]